MMVTSGSWGESLPGKMDMRIAALLLAIGLVAAPAMALGGHHGLFGGGGPRSFNGGHHGHSSINSWMGSHRPRLR